MADVAYSVNLSVSAGALEFKSSSGRVTSNFATAGILAVTLNLGTATQAISTAALSSLGLCYARSLTTTSTHTVSFGRLSGTTLFDVVRLRAGDAAVLRLAPGNYAAKAAVEGSRLLVQILEE